MVEAARIVESKERNKEEVQKLFGVHYWAPGSKAVYEAPEDHLYYFKTFIGPHVIEVERGDSCFFLSTDKTGCAVQRGPTSIKSEHFATVIRGYMPENKTRMITSKTNLPYVNGCSTKQIFPPERVGDPTLQQLIIPAYSAEQAHHIHSTVRVVYVLSGRGVSVVGMEGLSVKEELLPGMVCVLDPMCPHHFETPQGDPINVIPLHIFSSVGGVESNHPMFAGTHLMNQGNS